MSIEHMRKMTLYAGISIILSAFVLTGCSHESSTIIGLLREPETVLADLSEWPQQEIIPNMPEIIQYCDGGIGVDICSPEEYTALISQLEKYQRGSYLDIRINEKDVTIYLDELLAYNNFQSLRISNGGTISAKDIDAVNMDMLERIELVQIVSIDEGLISHVPDQTELRIDMGEKYRGISPELELLLDTDCQNVMVQWWDKGAETTALIGEQERLRAKLKEWDILRAVLTEEQGILCEYCRQVIDGYIYTEYEFRGQDTESITKAFICIKGEESNGRQYFDIIAVPEDRLQEVSHVYYWDRILLTDMNFDGYKDIIFAGESYLFDTLHCVYYLWDKAEKKYELDTTLPTRKLVNIDETRKRLTYSESASAFDDTYYIYQYDGERFREQKLWVVMDYLEQERESIVTWQYYEEGKLMGKLEWILGDNEDISYVFYEENGERIEEVTINKKVYYDEIGLMYFPEFDFCNMG